MGDKHRHDFQGQALIHAHPGGNVAHGYYGHAEDPASSNNPDEWRPLPDDDANPFTVIGVWDNDRAVPVGVVAGEHIFEGGDESHFPQGIWAISVDAPNALDAEQRAVLRMHANEYGMEEPNACDRCGDIYDEARGDGYNGLCPTCADETDPDRLHDFTSRIVRIEAMRGCGRRRLHFANGQSYPASETIAAPLEADVRVWVENDHGRIFISRVQQVQGATR